MQTKQEWSWDDMKLILALAREGSLLGAAKKLGVNASTIGRRLDALEEAFDVRIFDRTRQGVQMTAVAERLLPFAESAEQAADGFARTAEGFERELEGLVRISAPPGVASILLGRWVGEWLEQFPRLKIQIDAFVGYADLSRRETDIAIRSYRPTSGDLVSVKWLTGRSCIMGSQEYLESVGEITSLAQLRWINWGPSLAHMADAKWIEEHVPASQVLLQTDSIEVQLQAALKGMGALLIAEGLGKIAGLVPATLSKPLEAKLPPLLEGSLWLVGHRALRHVPRIDAIWNALLEKVQTPALQ